MPRQAYKPTQKHIETVRALKEKGASDIECAKALGISRNTFGKHKKVLFGQVIKEADEARQKSLMEVFEDSLPKQLTGYYVTEEIERLNPDTGELELFERKKKWMAPNATLMMYTSANRSDDWKSINSANSVDVKTDGKTEIKIGYELD